MCIRDSPQSPRASLRAKLDLANVEIVVCAMAAHFRGTKTSSFSLAIVEERAAIFGHASDTGGEMDVLAPPDEGAGKKDEL